MVATTLFVRGSMRETVPSPLFATQTLPAPYAIPTGARPTVMAVATGPVSQAMRETVSLAVLVTHTAPPPTATPLGCKPTVIGATLGLFVEGSMRVTLESSQFAIQTDPNPSAIAAGWVPANRGPTTCPDVGLIRKMLESP
jgi:hypothetical protein